MPELLSPQTLHGISKRRSPLLGNKRKVSFMWRFFNYVNIQIIKTIKFDSVWTSWLLLDKNYWLWFRKGERNFKRVTVRETFIASLCYLTRKTVCFGKKLECTIKIFIQKWCEVLAWNVSHTHLWKHKTRVFVMQPKNLIKRLVCLFSSFQLSVSQPMR